MLVKLAVSVPGNLNLDRPKLRLDLSKVASIPGVSRVPAVSIVGIIAKKGGQFAFQEQIESFLELSPHEFVKFLLVE